MDKRIGVRAWIGYALAALLFAECAAAKEPKVEMPGKGETGRSRECQ